MAWLLLKTFKFYFWLRGWKFVCEFDYRKYPKFILLGGGHTSNWDFVYGMGAFGYTEFSLNFTIKKEWLRFPFKTLMKNLGAIGIDRARKTGEKQTDILARVFDDRDEICLLVTPEGTRKAVTKWKSGFFYVAKAAGVPIVPGHLDYKNKIAHFGKAIESGNGYEKVMKEVMEYYKGITPRKMENFKLDERFV